MHIIYIYIYYIVKLMVDVTSLKLCIVSNLQKSKIIGWNSEKVYLVVYWWLFFGGLWLFVVV